MLESRWTDKILIVSLGENMSQNNIIKIVVKSLGFYLLLLAAMQIPQIINSVFSIIIDLAFSKGGGANPANYASFPAIKYPLSRLLQSIISLVIYLNISRYFIVIGPKLRGLIDMYCRD